MISPGTLVVCTKFKDQNVTTISAFPHVVQNHISTSVKVIRLDNGKEFINSQFRSLFQAKGIIYRGSSIYSLQRNGVVERRLIIMKDDL